MLAIAVALALALLGLALGAVPRLAASRWQLRAPFAALVLWQALGLTAGLLTLQVLLTVWLSAYGRTPWGALASWDAGGPWWAWLALVLALLVLLRLLGALLASAVRTVRARRRHRRVLDLVAARNPLLQGTHVVDHAVPVVYCLPGVRPGGARVVVSRGVLTALDDRELQAVLAHERAHLAQRHDLVVLPFVALGATFPWLPPVRCAEHQVGLLVEVLADRRAADRHDARVLARALAKVAGGLPPAGGLGAGGAGAAGSGGRGSGADGSGATGSGPSGSGGRGSGADGSGATGSGPPGPGVAGDVLLRVDRLLHPPPPLSAGRTLLVWLAAVGVLLVPVLGFLAPALV